VIKKHHWPLIWAVAIVALTALPYLYAWLKTPSGWRYTGLLVNPTDGNSYLAKMNQGARGEWLFQLPFTSEEHKGAPFFTFYLFLGHLASWTHLPPILVYHLARLACGFFLLWSGYRFIAHALAPEERLTAFLFLGLSSGLGWLALFFDRMSVDLWVPEAITFYALFTNPHFPLAMAMMPWLFLATLSHGRWQTGIILGSSLLLASVQPFCLLTVYGVLAGHGLLLLWREGRVPWLLMKRALTVVAASLPWLVFQYWQLTSNPAMKGWMAQNVTLSPPPWDYLLGYGVLAFLATGGLVMAFRRGTSTDLLLIAWVVVNALLLYAPFSLQRRLSLGLHMPLSLLAARGFHGLLVPRLRGRMRGLAPALAIAVMALTNLLVMLAALEGAMRGGHPLYLRQDEARALEWLRAHTQPQETVLASPEMGVFIPAWAGNRVFYGHPFETIKAKEKQALAEDFFRNPDDAVRVGLLQRYDIAYLFYGPAERSLGDLSPATKAYLQRTFKEGEVEIYRVVLSDPGYEGRSGYAMGL